ncbi:hypothetical protein CYMTET_31720 [Cymbomonas tetramitiformis]|uniref:Uncharacterized protein n=1 Tax=Cymbomonas tetramitiformis TaxID=36881 RepID=A0AAE0FGQ8_9CHLO|nr:hypothetical protein CYMTET_31720 [Cymbomonas tetramitiformis]
MGKTSTDGLTQERGRWELGDSSLTDLAVRILGLALQDTAMGKYRPKAEAFVQFCVAEGRTWLPAMKALPT